MSAAALVRLRESAERRLVLKLCEERGQTVVTQGGLIGWVEGATTSIHDVVISLERMNVIEEIDTIGRMATVQAAVALQTLQQAVREEACTFPFDLSARGC